MPAWMLAVCLGVFGVQSLYACTYDVDPDVHVRIECVAVELGSGAIVECPDASDAMEEPAADAYVPPTDASDVLILDANGFDASTDGLRAPPADAPEELTW